jgi:hypothetical protein
VALTRSKGEDDGKTSPKNRNGKEAEMTEAISGICKHCGCTDGTPCVLKGGQTCCWVDREHTVCSARDCVAEAYREAAARVAAELDSEIRNELADAIAGWAPEVEG